MARVTPPPIDPVPTPPIQRGDRATFSSRVDAFIRWLTTAVAQFQAAATNVYNNTVDAFQSATSASTSAGNAAASAGQAATSATAASSSAAASEASSIASQGYAAGLSATSTTSLTISAGSKTFTGAGLVVKQFTVGQILRAVNPTNTAQWMAGAVTAYTSNGASSSLTLDVTDVNAATSGQTVANWSISISGVKGPQGATGGVNGGNLTGALNKRRATNDVASASTIDIWSGSGNYIGVTGTATITGFTAAPQAGASRRLLIAGLSFITSGANLSVKGGATSVPLPLYPGDEIYVVAETATKFQATVFRADGTSVAGGGRIVLQDLKTPGTSGGTVSGNQEIVRTLTTMVSNSIIGASLSANRFTLPAGMFEIWADAPCANPANHRISLWNVTDNVRAIVGSVGYTAVVTVMDRAVLYGQINLSSPKEFEIRHYFVNAANANNLGFPINQPGVPEIYTSVRATKLS